MLSIISAIIWIQAFILEFLVHPAVGSAQTKCDGEAADEGRETPGNITSVIIKHTTPESKLTFDPGGQWRCRGGRGRRRGAGGGARGTAVELHSHGEPPPHTEQTSSCSSSCSRGGRGDGGGGRLAEAEGTGGEGEGGGEGGGRGGALLFHWSVLKQKRRNERVTQLK